MRSHNFTLVSDFILAGLVIHDDLRVIVFLCLLLLYIINLAANLSILMIAITDLTLHTPMYFFLANVAFLEICYSSVVVPKMLIDLFMSKNKMISFWGCMLQVHFFHFFGSTEVILFSVMSYDRYVAIAHPLRYSAIMSSNIYQGLALCSWVIGFSHALLHTIMTARLPFCGPNVVKHFFCDVKPMLSLACTDVSLNFNLLTRVTGTIVITTLILTIFFYIFIGKFLFKIKTSQGRKRALSTCSAHFTVITLQYGTAIFTYAQPPTKDSLDQDRSAAIMFTIITPALNPIIYTLRNKDMKKALNRRVRKCLVHKNIMLMIQYGEQRYSVILDIDELNQYRHNTS
ncbi:olfactory receptor 12D2-like [Hyla sarda]|uniref:olfactory receptor 12D2-like n=1 Tax=Hyla sarda TaxID=327740 RepID=UPI0024C3E490|nr:olfactory receptor 12D2-like [Hyla sarda]